MSAPQHPQQGPYPAQQQHALDLVEDIVAGVFAAIGVLVWTGLALGRQAWVNDRPRRQWKRTRRRNRWRRARGWRRNLLAAELVVVVGYLITRSVIRFPRGAWHVGRAAAATGWISGVSQARTERAVRRGYPLNAAGQPAAQPAAGRPAADGQPSSGSPSADDPPPSPAPKPAPTVTVTGVSSPGDVVDAVLLCNWLEADGAICDRPLPEGEMFCPHHGADGVRVPIAAAATSRRWDGQPETDADRRFFDLRESGYDGWIDMPTGMPVATGPDGWPVNSTDDGYVPVDDDPANAAVPCPACAGAACLACGNGLVPAWAVDQSFGVVPATDAHPPAPAGNPPSSGAAPAPVTVTVIAVPDPIGRNTSVMTTTTVSTTSRTSGGGSIATDLQNVSDLQLETNRILVVLEQFEELGKLIRTWTTTLPERVQAAPFGTKNINQAVAGVSEHGGKSGALREELEVLRRACAQALGLGDHISGLQAEGKTTSYTVQ